MQPQTRAGQRLLDWLTDHADDQGQLALTDASRLELSLLMDETKEALNGAGAGHLAI